VLRVAGTPTLPRLSRLTNSLPQITRLATEGSISNGCHLDIYHFAALLFNQLSTMNACRWHLCYWQAKCSKCTEGRRASYSDTGQGFNL